MKKTKEKASLTREQLTDSALQLFILHGYSNVTLQDIADKIGATRGAFYWHFKSKEEILNAICYRETDFITNMITDLFLITGMDPAPHLQLILTRIIENYFDNQSYRDFIELTWFKMEHFQNEKANHLKTITNEYFIEETDKIINKGIKTAVFRDEALPGAWAAYIAAMINGIYRLYFISPKYMSRKTALAMIDQLLITIMK